MPLTTDFSFSFNHNTLLGLQHLTLFVPVLIKADTGKCVYCCEHEKTLERKYFGFFKTFSGSSFPLTLGIL